jgi:rhodanese-related sulfurtransferase
MRLVKLLLLAVSLSIAATAVQAKVKDEFPVRKLYPAVPYILLDDLYAERNKVIIVDVRSSYEYETLRIKGALNIPLSSPNYVKDMKKLRADNPKTKIIVYCNGKTCKKSYKAAQKCRNNQISNVIAYDAGIMDWANKYPNDSVLLGRSPIDPSRLIKKSTFKKKLMDPEKFETMVADKNVLVVDVRDSFQREALSLFPGIDNRAFLDDRKAIKEMVDKANRQNKTLLIYDATGKQVRWLMYLLQDLGAKDYWFMKGGSNAYFAALRKQMLK